MKTIDIVYFNAGGGHRSAAQALQRVIREQERPWTVRTLDLFEVLDPKGRFESLTGMRPEAFYNLRLARGWTLGMSQELRLLQGLIRVASPAMRRVLERHWRENPPDLVVSVVPNFNRVMHDALHSVRPGTPCVTILTDLADHPPRFWIERGQRQYVVCGTPRAAAQARDAGVPDSRVFETSGMVLRPDFYRAAPIDRDATRRALGLEPDRLTGLVLFGGHGSRAMLSIARRLADTQLVMVCGHNTELADALRRLPASAPRCIVGYTDRIAQLMQASDFFVGKPGPGSVSEAVRMGLPVLVVDNAWTMPQERYNAQWIRERDIGVVLRSFRSVVQGVEALQRRLPQLTANARAIDNHAVFEIPAILARILLEHDANALAPPESTEPEAAAALDVAGSTLYLQEFP
jgi:UDP-N-acetylglucosamine:LPS N-acetylglucosamine transferase